MRLHVWAFVLAGFLFSCNNANNDKQAEPDTAKDAEQSQNASPRTVSDAVQDLKSILESNDPDRIAGLFEFPLTDTVMAVYLDDSVFRKRYVAAGDKLTKNLFLQYFDTIARSNNLSDIAAGLKYLPVDSLRYTNKLSKAFKDKKEPCTREYSIEVENDEVKITYSTNQNDLFVVPKNKQDDDEYYSGCEYAAFWFFRFDGNKLKFLRFAAAG